MLSVRGALYTRPMSWFTSLQLVLPLLPLQALLQLFDPLLRVAVVVVVMGGLSGTAEREREREKVCALAHVHSVLEVEVPVGQGDEANGTHAQYLRRSEAHDQVHATTSQPRAPARVASPRLALEILAVATQLVCVKKIVKKRER